MAEPVTSTRADLSPRTRNVLVTLLAVNSGYIDAVGFLALGGAFTSVMTGNMVLLGLSAGTADASLASHAALAIVCFIAGCALGTRVAGIHEKGDPIWPPSVSRALYVELALVIAFAVSWWLLSDHPDRDWQLPLLALNAMALGLQSSAVQRFGVSGLSTTYLTGTLTQMVIRLTSGHPVRQIAHSGSLLIGLIAGAALGGVVSAQVRWLVPLPPIVLLTTAVAGAYYTRIGISRGTRLPEVADVATPG
jgi:uncharacterized membrane protein YoaK (UPF0700 family)